jgi:hypothetical protein
MLDLTLSNVDASIPGQDANPNDTDEVMVEKNIAFVPQAGY